jgi:transcriptional regulator with XRE-family HTH domain
VSDALPRDKLGTASRFGQLIARRRHQLGLTQSDLADHLCERSGRPTFTRHEVSRYERGVRLPTAPLLAVFADSLDLPVAVLRQAAAADPEHRHPGSRKLSAAHRVLRPSWTCASDGLPWPCSEAQQALSVNDLAALQRTMAKLMAIAGSELPDRRPDALYRRFLAWTFEPGQRCTVCGSRRHAVIPGVPPRLIPCNGNASDRRGERPPQTGHRQTASRALVAIAADDLAARGQNPYASLSAFVSVGERPPSLTSRSQRFPDEL